MASLEAIPGSFRDPGGRVYRSGTRIFRTVMPSAAEDFEAVEASGLLARLVERGLLLGYEHVAPSLVGEAAHGARYVLEHPRLPFVSYPYEWPFAALKSAALLHLDLMLEALQSGAMLVDATAYNVQFRGAEPVFIDTLSFRRYVPGSYWIGHRQFCEQFLNPLLLRACFGIDQTTWYRGAMEGVSGQDLDRLLPWWRKLSPGVLMHVTLPARLQGRPNARESATTVYRKQSLPPSALAHMLRGLRRWIARLEPARSGATAFANYANDNTYDESDREVKSRFVAEFVAAARPRMLLDLGCNTGYFAEVALAAGAQGVIGVDGDKDAVEQAYVRARSANRPILPLVMNLGDPSPERGWAQRERAGLWQRCQESCDAVLALALVHHLAIAGNVPLAQAVEWIVSLAPTGVIEFVPRADPMVARLLALREDIFADYDEATFMAALSARATIVAQTTIPGTARKLFQFARH